MDILSCAQLNTHHCKAAMAQLSLSLNYNKVDILFNQEPYCYNGTPCLIPPNYTAFYAKGDTGLNPRACLLVKNDIVHNFITIHNHSNPDNIIITTTSTNPPLYLASSYLPPYDTLEQDLSTIESFLTFSKPTNFVWGLDANSKHPTWHSPITDPRGRKITEFLTAQSLITVNEKDGPTFAGAQGNSWIDITATTINAAHNIQNWHVSKEETLSDHNLIIYNIINQRPSANITRQVSHSTRKFATQVGKRNLYKQKLQNIEDKWMHMIEKPNTKEELENSISTIWSDLEEINSSCFPPFLPTNKFVPWWSTELNLLRKQTNAAKRRFRRCKNQTLKEIYKEKFNALVRNYKNELLKAKQESWKQFCTVKSKDSPWKIYRTCKREFERKQAHSTLILQDGSSTLNAEDTATALLNKFFPDDLPALDSVEQNHVRTRVTVRGAPATQPEPNFAPHEVDETITRVNNNKCPGPDGIDGVIVKMIHTILPNFWITLFNKCLKLGCFPSTWKNATIIAIPKADKSKHRLITGYRGISLLSIPGKCMEKLIMDRLNFHLESSGRIPQQQYGFTAGKSTADAIKAVTDYVHHNRQQGLKCCLLALDIAGAFDNAWHPGILERLWNLDCPPNIFHIIKEFLRNRTASYKIGNVAISKQVTKGCPQGSVAGPTLWNIIISDLIEHLSNIPDLNIIMYADDIMIMLKGRSHSHILNTLQTALEHIEDWCKTQKLEIAKDKTALMPMYIRKRTNYNTHPTVIKWGIKVVSKMKYLGVMLDCKMDWFPHTQFLENKILKLRNNLIRCSKTSWGISYHHLLTIYNHAILPVVTYAAEAWCQSISRRATIKLTQIQRSFLMFAIKAYKTVSSVAMQAIAGTMPIEQALLLSNDIKAVRSGLPTNAVLPKLKKTELVTRCRGIHPKDNIITIGNSGTVIPANIQIFTDGSKTENHVGAGLVAEENAVEIYIEARRLDNECSVFQAELLGIQMAVDWIIQQSKVHISYAIHVDSQAALYAIANRRTTQPIAVYIRKKIITLKKSTQISLNWVRGHTGIRGNERADYLAKIAASYNNTITYNSIPISRAKQLLLKYYVNIWNATYTNSEVAHHTKQFIPSIHHRLSLALWPNYILTQFLTNHGCFRTYLHRINKAPSPLCNCPEKPPQTARHLLTECSLHSRDRPPVLTTQTLPQILKFHINTVAVANFISKIFRPLQE